MEEELYQLATGLLRVVIAMRPERAVRNPANIRELGLNADRWTRLNGSEFTALGADIVPTLEPGCQGATAVNLILRAVAINNSIAILLSRIESNPKARELQLREECSNLIEYLRWTTGISDDMPDR